MDFGEIVIWSWAVTLVVGFFFVLCAILEAASYIANLNKIEKMADRLIERVAKVICILMLVSIFMTVVFGFIKLISLVN